MFSRKEEVRKRMNGRIKELRNSLNMKDYLMISNYKCCGNILNENRYQPTKDCRILINLHENNWNFFSMHKLLELVFSSIHPYNPKNI